MLTESHWDVWPQYNKKHAHCAHSSQHNHSDVTNIYASNVDHDMCTKHACGFHSTKTNLSLDAAIYSGGTAQQHTYIGGWLQHVVPVPARDGHEGNRGWVVANLLDVGADLLDDLIIALLAVCRLRGIHLVDAHDELLHPQGVSQQGMLTGLPVLGDASFKLTDASSNNQHGTVSLGGQR